MLIIKIKLDNTLRTGSDEMMMICDMCIFTIILACGHIFLEDLHQNHVLLTPNFYALLFWAIPKEFDWLSMTPKTRK